MAVTAQGSGTKTPTIGTFTVTIATPGVCTFASNQLANGDAVVLSTTGALPTGLTAGTTYYVVNLGTSGANTFRLALTVGGADINTSGTQSGTHTIVTEHTLLDIAVAGTFTYELDLNALAAGDVVELRIYKIILTAGTRRVCYFQRYYDAQSVDNQIAVSVPTSNELTDAGSIRVTLRQTVGTARAFPWKVLKYA